MNWLLPEYLSDALPAEAENIENLRRAILDQFRTRAYELVIPPHLEYIESLLTGAGQDLNLRTFKLVDQLSGRTLGVRADMTPQVARIDAHLLNRQGVTRLCYCDSVLHTLPASLAASREPVQLGAEIYGYAGLAADLEIIRLMSTVLEQSRLDGIRIDLGHVGIFRALVDAATLDSNIVEQLFTALQAKDTPGLLEICADLPHDSPARAVALLTQLYGGVEVLEKARQQLPKLQAIEDALNTLQLVFEQAGHLPLSVDLAELPGYHYHNGLVFAAYCNGYPAAIARGGRYDGVGAAFGRARPATGFSTDLRELARLATPGVKSGAVMAPHIPSDVELQRVIQILRDQSQVVLEQLPGDLPCEGPVCDRRLTQVSGRWIVEAI